MRAGAIAALLGALSSVAIACAGSTTVSGQVDVGAPSASASTPPPASDVARAGEADVRRLTDDVKAIAVRRSPGSEGWYRARERCATRLDELGFERRTSVFTLRGVSPSLTYVNVVGVKRGTSRPDEEIVVSAHYDHVDNCPGADDDASGVAASLEIARLLSAERHDRTLVVACWDLEEDGLVGSTFYANTAKEAGAQIKLAVALDAVGYTNRNPNSQSLPPGLQTLAPRLAKQVEKGEFRADFIALVHDPDAADFVTPFEEEAKKIGLRTGVLEVSTFERLVMNDVLRADHASFWLAGYPAILISDSGEFRNPGYHCWEAVDSPDTLDYPFLAQVTSATAVMVRAALDAP